MTKTKGQSLAVFIGSSSALFLTALFTMLMIGVLHSTYSAIPTVGYWVTVAALWLVRNVYQYVIVDFLKMFREQNED